MKFPMICLFGVTLATAAPAQQAALPKPVVLPAPLLEMGGPTSGSVGLTLLSAKPNQITDDEQWWRRNDLRKPELYLKFPAGERGTIPKGAPVAYRGSMRRSTCDPTNHRFDPVAHFVVVMRRTNRCAAHPTAAG